VPSRLSSLPLRIAVPLAREDPFDPVAAQDLIYGVQVNNRTFYVGLFNNGTSVCSYNISARMESTFGPLQHIVCRRSADVDGCGGVVESL
jgi:hypothetical protein